MKISRFIQSFILTAFCILLICASSSHAKRTSKDKRAELVIDVKTGRVLYSYKSDHLRHPASLTKLMTLYLLFEAIDTGKLKSFSKIRISKNATKKPPSKLGLKAGQYITVRDAAYTLIIKSANDIATAVAEELGGSEIKFAKMMTLKARRLGMTRTLFRNASGLPDKRQVTTARDMAVLGIRLMQRFPHYYKYFATHKKIVAGKTIRTHNHLLKTYPGMDGMKTGFINMSGFNLVSSAQRGNNRLITVVMGGKTYRKRDKKVAELTDIGWKRLKNPRGYRQFIGVSMPRLSALSTKFRPLEAKKFQPFHITSSPEKINQHHSLKNKSDFKMLPQMRSPLITKTMQPITVEQIQPTQITKRSAHYKLKDSVVIKKSGWSKIKKDTLKGAVAKNINKNIATNKAKSTVSSSDIAVKTPQKTLPTVDTILEKGDSIATHKNWTIQVGAFSKKHIANNYLTKLMEKHQHLSQAQPELIAVKKGKKYFYRARFTGFNAKKAKESCKLLKEIGHNCIMTGILP